jgi:molecular chaperone GrpE
MSKDAQEPIAADVPLTDVLVAVAHAGERHFGVVGVAGDKLVEAGKRELILPLLAVIDDLEHALQWASGTEQPLADGLRLIHQKLLALLENQGVRPFDSVGKMFTPELHKAVAVSKRKDVEPGTVVEELRRGYLCKNELLRPAEVRVAA